MNLEKNLKDLIQNFNFMNELELLNFLKSLKNLKQNKRIKHILIELTPDFFPKSKKTLAGSLTNDVLKISITNNEWPFPEILKTMLVSQADIQTVIDFLASKKMPKFKSAFSDIKFDFDNRRKYDDDEPSSMKMLI